MRDPKRISRIIAKIEKIWQHYPDWRLGQLVSNMQGGGPHDVFFLDDSTFEDLLDLELNNIKNTAKV